MLGEDHSIVKEFPQYKDTILQLMKDDSGFAKDCKHYNALDKEIRVLELNNDPIADNEMHQLKHNRSILKDALYQRLLKAG